MNTRQPLKEFMSAYFHEDWPMDAQSPRDVISLFFRDQKSVEALLPIAQALHELVATDEDDETLSGRLFREFGSYFDPRGMGESTRVWLINLANDFEREIASRGVVRPDVG